MPRARVKRAAGSPIGPVNLAPTKALIPSDAAVAIICTKDGRYLLQHRDPKPTIFYPDHWGFFGGALEHEESPAEGLLRELQEELSIDFSGHNKALFTHFSFHVQAAGLNALNRYYYELKIDPEEVASMRLQEGAGMALVGGEEALHEIRLVPYDAFALWLHFHQGMLMPGKASPIKRWAV